MPNPPASLMTLPIELHTIILSHLSPYDIHILSLTNRYFASITPLPTIMTLSASLHISVLSHLQFWDIYALRLTTRHFASITPPLGSQISLLNDLIYSYPEPYAGPQEDAYNKSWLAISSNLSFCSCCGFGDSFYVWHDSIDGRGGASEQKTTTSLAEGEVEGEVESTQTVTVT